MTKLTIGVQKIANATNVFGLSVAQSHHRHGRRQLSKRLTLGSGNYSDNESAWGTAVRSTLKWHPPHPEAGPGDAHE